MLKTVGILILRSWLLETRQKHALGGILLYLLSTVFVCYLSFEQMNSMQSWNALLWIILLFITTNATNNSFKDESGKHLLYIYTIVTPQALILSKMIYTSMLNLVLSFIAYTVYSILLGQLVENQGLFFVAIGLGSCGLSFLLTMNAAITTKASNNSAMIAILSFPLVLPLILTLIKISMIAIVGGSFGDASSLIIILIALNILIGAMAYLLFPYLWRE